MKAKHDDVKPGAPHKTGIRLNTQDSEKGENWWRQELLCLIVRAVSWLVLFDISGVWNELWLQKTQPALLVCLTLKMVNSRIPWNVMKFYKVVSCHCSEQLHFCHSKTTVDLSTSFFLYFPFSMEYHHENCENYYSWVVRYIFHSSFFVQLLKPINCVYLRIAYFKN